MSENKITETAEKNNRGMNRIAWAAVSVVVVAVAVLALLEAKNGWLSGTNGAENRTAFSLAVTVDGSEVLFDSKVAANEGETLIDVMVREITEDGGVEYTTGEYGAYITAICGNSEDPDTMRYWVYTVNGESVMEGAGQFVPVEGDEVVFDLSVLEW